MSWQMECVVDVKLVLMVSLRREHHDSYTHHDINVHGHRPWEKLVSSICTLVIAYSYMAKMGTFRRVSMDVDSAIVRLTLPVSAGDGVQAVLGVEIGQVSS
jgi:hypothetical protein